MNVLDNSSFHASSPATAAFPDDPTVITDGNASGWHRYRNSLINRKIKETTHRWYALHVKAFLNYFYEQRLSDLDADIVTLHLQQLIPSQFSKDWQHRQYIKAVEILLTDTANLQWARAIEWDQVKRNTASLPNSHATIARETDGLCPVEPVYASTLDEGQRESLLALSRELRVRRYAIKTEQSYCNWAQRFLLESQGVGIEDLSSAAAQTFLSNLVLRRNVSKSPQNQALTALAFYFNEILGRPLSGLDHIRSRRPAKIPVVLTCILHKATGQFEYEPVYKEINTDIHCSLN